MELPPIETTVRSGDEAFTAGGAAAGLQLMEFWRWALSDLVTNANRGLLAEFLVARALGLEMPVRNLWDAYDLQTPEGLRVEVKSAAYVQSWYQKSYTKITFSVGPTRAWEAQTASFASEVRRQVDIYVFALLHHKDQATIDPLNLDQWTFYVLPTARLDGQPVCCKSISMARLKSLQPIECGFRELKKGVASCLQPENDGAGS
jgi:hypothetical protein